MAYIVTNALPDFRAVSLDVFNSAVAHYHKKTPAEDLSDQELWVQYTKWRDVDTQVSAETGYAAGLRLTARRYLAVLAAECCRRGLLREGGAVP